MREIKFRGKRFDDGMWIYGSYTHCQDGNGYTTIIPFRANYHVPVVTETVGQYIGVHDEDENEMYEGDIIRMVYMDEKIECSIQHCDIGFLLASDDFEEGFVWITDVTENDGRFFWIPTAVKIGNIYDNPEWAEG